MQRRNTKQKRLIYDCLLHLRSHPSVEELHTELCKQGTPIGIATIYRELNRLADEGVILRIHKDQKEDHFDGVIDGHLHFICKRCGAIIDIYDIKALSYLKRQLKKYALCIDTYQIIMEGICNDCKGESSNEEISM